MGVDYIRVGLDKVLCKVCQWNKGEYRENEVGNIMHNGLLLCRECRERLIRIDGRNRALAHKKNQPFDEVISGVQFF